MPKTPQPDLFGNEPIAPPSYLPDPADVRAKLHLVLSQAKAAPSVPWRASLSACVPGSRV